MRAAIFLPVLALALGATAATPPGCLLQALTTQDDPSDLKAVCGDDAKDVQQAIASQCAKENSSAAQSAFIATCSSVGSKVAPYTASSSATKSSSGSSPSSTASGSGSASSASETGSSSSDDSSSGDSAATTGSGSSAPQATGNMASNYGLSGSHAAAIVAAMGIVVGL